MSLFMLGCATNGFAVLIIQSTVLLVMQNSQESDVIKASYVYFVTCAVILFVCLLLFRNMLKYPIIDEKLNPPKEDPNKKKSFTSFQLRFQAALRYKIGFQYNDMFANIHGAVITMPTAKVQDGIETQKSISMSEAAPWSLICSTYRIIWPMALTMVVIYA